MKLIDAKELQKQFDLKSTNPNYRVNMHNIKSIIRNTPTVEAIPKADYEARLKADMVNMLEELDFRLSNYQDTDLIRQDIQEKITKLKESNE